MRQDPGRRGTYFAFQGLLLAVLILLFAVQRRNMTDWAPRLSFLLTVLGASLVFLQTAPQQVLAHPWVQVGLFLGDAGLASLTLYWTRSQSYLILAYALILFGTALMRNLKASLLVALVTSALYLASAWKPGSGFQPDESLWLRVMFLWVATSCLAILARDHQQHLSDAERDYRERLTQLERLATLGQVAGEIAHRIKGPLTTILVNAEVLSHRYGRSPRIRRELEQIEQEVGHCKEILKSLLDLGRIEEIRLRPLDLREPVLSAVKSLEPQLGGRRLRLETAGLESPAEALGDQSLLHEAVAAILQNAIEASEPGGVIGVSLAAHRRKGWWASPSSAQALHAVTIEDRGKGIAPEELEQVFRPFFSTKGKEGTGLGLSAALRILQKHGGTIEASSQGPGLGARFTVLLPALRAGKPRRRRRD